MMWFLLLLLYMGSSSVLANLSRRDSSLDLKQWSVGHEANDDHLLRLSIILTIQDDDLGVQTLLRISDPASPDYGQYMSAKEVARMFAPSPNTVSDVMEWLEDSGIDAAQVNLSHTGDRMSLDLSVQKATLLLGTTFYHQTHKRTGQERVAFQHYHIPQSLSGSIEYIYAVSSVSVQQQLAHRRPIGNNKGTTAATPPSASLTHQQIPQHQLVLNDRFTTPGPLPPNCLQQTTLSCLRILYGIPDNVSPHINNSLGVYEPSWISWLEEDLDKFFGQHQKNLVGHRPKVDAINGGYLQRNYTGSVWNQEPNLDFEYTMALTSPQEVTNIQVGSYEQSGNLNDMLAAFDEYYCDHLSSGYTRDPPIYPPGCNATSCDCGSSSAPKVVSISWGWTEADFAAKYLQRQCLEFLKLGLMGTTVVVSVSDHGTASEGGHFCVDDPTGNATGGRFSPTFPSSCPWVTTVGGTQMLQPTSLEAPGTIANETAFRKVIAGTLASSGGGFSNVFRAPPYQALQVASYQDVEKEHLGKIQDCFSSAGRGYPDVAARADDYLIVSNGQWKLTSGTSASNPVFASIITLINSERMHRGKGSVGFINPVLYSNPDILNDIVTGANQGCGIDQAFRATRGWDAVTGLGSPDYQRMRRLFLDLP